MKAEEYLRAGRAEDALKSLQETVRENAADPKLRVFLFQLFCVLGKWERALTQLQVLASMNDETMLLAQIFQPVIQCEVLRGEIFAGKRTPLIFGEPAEWIGLLVQANQSAATGNFKGALQLRDKAFETAPTSEGKLNGQDFAWIADADSRLGPLLEVILEGRYYWVPFQRVKSIEMQAPSDLRDLVWRPAQFIWTNGGQALAHIPVRYAGTENAKDDQLRLSRKTDWLENVEGYPVGLGQRMFATDAGEHSLLECKTIELSSAA